LLRLLVLLALLAGCAADVDDRNCQGYGYEPGSEGYANCRMQSDQTRKMASATIAAQNPYLRY
jgi:hypothetical protein